MCVSEGRLRVNKTLYRQGLCPVITYCYVNRIHSNNGSGSIKMCSQIVDFYYCDHEHCYDDSQLLPILYSRNFLHGKGITENIAMCMKT